jgi:hypothetical protein
MGWYLRKALSAGPFRFNLSRSGLGLSVGVKGARDLCRKSDFRKEFDAPFVKHIKSILGISKRE